MHEQQWPLWEEAKLEERTATVAVQINGKRRGQIEVERGVESDEETLRAAVQRSDLGRQWLEADGEPIPVKRVIVPVGRGLINFVLG